MQIFWQKNACRRANCVLFAHYSSQKSAISDTNLPIAPPCELSFGVVSGVLLDACYRLVE